MPWAGCPEGTMPEGFAVIRVPGELLCQHRLDCGNQYRQQRQDSQGYQSEEGCGLKVLAQGLPMVPYQEEP